MWQRDSNNNRTAENIEMEAVPTPVIRSQGDDIEPAEDNSI